MALNPPYNTKHVKALATKAIIVLLVKLLVKIPMAVKLAQRSNTVSYTHL